MTSPLARRVHNATNALHSLIYFALAKAGPLPSAPSAGGET